MLFTVRNTSHLIGGAKLELAVRSQSTQFRAILTLCPAHSSMEATAALNEDASVACGGLYIMVQVTDSSMRWINIEGLDQLHAHIQQDLSSTYHPFPRRDVRFPQHAQ